MSGLVVPSGVFVQVAPGVEVYQDTGYTRTLDNRCFRVVLSEPEVDADEPTDAPPNDDEGLTQDDAQMLLRLVSAELNRISVSMFTRAAHSLTGGSVTALDAINQAAEQLRGVKTKLEKIAE